MESKSTAYALLEHLRDGPSTAAALAGRVGVDVAAARRHLEDHLTEGRVAAVFRQSGLGRPKKVYEITLAGREALPRRYDLLAELVFLSLAEESADTTARIVERLAQRFAADLKKRMPADGDLKARARALAQGLRSMGFPTELETQGDHLVIRRRDCVFLRAAQASPTAVCRGFDTRLLEILLGEDVELRACLPEGAACCEHRVSLRRNN